MCHAVIKKQHNRGQKIGLEAYHITLQMFTALTVRVFSTLLRSKDLRRDVFFITKIKSCEAFSQFFSRVNNITMGIYDYPNMKVKCFTRGKLWGKHFVEFGVVGVQSVEISIQQSQPRHVEQTPYRLLELQYLDNVLCI